MYNDFGAADAANEQARSGLSNMMARRDDYQGLVALMGQAFLGQAGTANGDWQRQFGLVVEEFFGSLRQLNVTLASTTGSGGSVQAMDNAAASGFSGIA